MEPIKPVKAVKTWIFVEQNEKLDKIAKENDTKKAILIRRAIDMLLNEYKKKTVKKKKGK